MAHTSASIPETAGSSPQGSEFSTPDNFLITRVGQNLGYFGIHSTKDLSRSQPMPESGSIRGGIVFATVKEGIAVRYETDPSILNRNVTAAEVLMDACNRELYARRSEDIVGSLREFGEQSAITVFDGVGADKILGGILLTGEKGSDELDASLFLRTHLRSAFAWEASRRRSDPRVPTSQAVLLPTFLKTPSAQQTRNLDWIVMNSLAVCLPEDPNELASELGLEGRQVNAGGAISIDLGFHNFHLLK